MLKKSFLLILLSLCGLVYGQTSGRHFEDSGNFSICFPMGWTVYELPGLKYKIFYDNSNNGFSPNIVILDEIFEGSLDDYLHLNNLNM